MLKQSLTIIGLLLLSACSRPLAITQVSYQERRMTDTLTAYDQRTEEIIRPFRDSMQMEMKQVLVISDTILTKQAPESDLGNLLAEIMLDKARSYSHRSVDLAVINLGGIRISQLPAGNITTEKVFELMPFDNKIVLLEIDGATLQKLFDRMATAGGIPIAGARYVIDAGKAVQINIQGRSLDPAGTYTLAISDYLASGGDNLDILKPIPQINTGALMRDAFIGGFREMNAKGRHLKSLRDGRVSIIHNN